MKARFFDSATALRRWFSQHYAQLAEQWIGFNTRDSGKGGITYPQALDEALCFGWIDGVRKSLHSESDTIRFIRLRRVGFFRAFC
jgi:uncharacterized protein YdeI (YjbR/CyaY-like superfamily)